MPDEFCANCGHRNARAANFCSSCGAALTGAHHDHTVLINANDETGEVHAAEVTVAVDDFRDAGMLVVKRGTEEIGAGVTYVLDAATISAGRSPDADMFLDDVTVSRQHAVFTRTADGYTVADRASMNGTYVNRERISERLLHSGDEVQIGKFRLVFLFGGD